jgi:biopolymer transport protein ExbD
MAPVDRSSAVETSPSQSEGCRPGAAGHKVKTELNVIPLVDVMFMMILFFVLGTHFRQSEGQIPATLPRDGGPGEGSSVQGGQLQISIRPDGGDGAIYEVSGHRGVIHDGAELYQALEARRGEIGDAKTVIISPGSETRWQYAVEAFNQAVRARYKAVGFGAVAG